MIDNPEPTAAQTQESTCPSCRSEHKNERYCDLHHLLESSHCPPHPKQVFCTICTDPWHSVAAPQPAPQPTAPQCPQCDSRERRKLNDKCQSKPYQPIHLKQYHPWHDASPVKAESADDSLIMREFRVALQRIETGSECECQHDDENCCEEANEFCSGCIAAKALQGESGSTERLKTTSPAAECLEALRELVAKLKIILPKIDDMCTMEAIHGRPYSGPTIGKELARAEAAIKSTTAKDAGKGGS